ncbi:NUDIX hydrolase [Actinomadura viridis]|uniref:NUDIX hydrolase n=1 Tax=Actinomadura viridis TaxID=58110 RepID=UPI0036C8BF49
MNSLPKNNAGPAGAIESLKDKVFGVLVSAATFHEDSILLLRRSLEQKFMPGAWSIPAGKIQPWEKSLEHAALRELAEEGGIDGQVLAPLGVTWFESVYCQHPLYNIQFDFAVRSRSDAVELHDGSNVDYMWLPMGRVEDPPVELDKFTRQVIEKAARYYRAYF